MRLNKIIQRDCTSFSLYYQIKLPLDLEISIPSDDPVRLVSAFVEEIICTFINDIHIAPTIIKALQIHGFCFKGMNAFDEYASQKVSIHILYYDIYLKLSIFTLVFQRLLLIFIVGAA